LRLSSAGRKGFTTGEIVNLMAVDPQRIVDFVSTINMVWSSPLQIIICIILIWYQLGVATLAGLGVMILFVVFNGFMTNIIKRLQARLMIEKDKRNKLINELLNGIKVLKLYAWEIPFINVIYKIRELEIEALKHQAIYMSFMSMTFSCAPFLVS